nr:hypothetical protein [uncultured Prevotella sp.]
METKINIAEILKDKPKGTKLYADAFGELSFDGVGSNKDEIIFTKTEVNTSWCFYNDGKFSKFGNPILVPSKEMRNWSKFAWKKGDVLIGVGQRIIFEKFIDENYTKFQGKYSLSTYEDRTLVADKRCYTSDFRKLDDNVNVKNYFKEIEEKLGGKLNRETLEVEKAQTEFKDGDILYITDRIVSCNFIMIYKNQEGDRIYRYATLPEDNLVIMTKGGFLSDNGGLSKRYATEEEKQQLFEALAKKGKAWDAEKKAIVDLKPKCEFKPFDRCIWKIRNCEGSIWQASFVSYVDEYGATPMGMSIDEDLVNLIILPYNEETAKLIGTTDNWEGGKQ